MSAAQLADIRPDRDNLDEFINSAEAGSMKDLQGKRVLVTGGSRGIGAAIALTLARNGAESNAQDLWIGFGRARGGRTFPNDP
ncbi:hypothetical protein [Streptomyces niveus]|uniref:hypothetical protein n=1 Tax=Streptomyces niveus TaxID=193462 RepID=UPI00386EDF47